MSIFRTTFSSPKSGATCPTGRPPRRPTSRIKGTLPATPRAQGEECANEKDHRVWDGARYRGERGWGLGRVQVTRRGRRHHVDRHVGQQRRTSDGNRGEQIGRASCREKV